MLINIILLSIGILCLLAAMAFLVKPIVPAAVTAYAALCLLHWSNHISLPDNTFLFWGIATLLIQVINSLSPKAPSRNTATVSLYMCVATMGGMLIGMSINASFMILGAIIGTFLGELAYFNTPNGKWLKFPSSIFIHYFCAVGFPIIVTIAMIGIALQGFVMN